jgi:hypothetical protein
MVWLPVSSDQQLCPSQRNFVAMMLPFSFPQACDGSMLWLHAIRRSGHPADPLVRRPVYVTTGMSARTSQIESWGTH